MKALPGGGAIRGLGAAALLLIAATCVTGVAARVPSSVGAVVDDYLDRYFRTFPTQATAAGRHDLDATLEDLAPGRRRAWLGFNETAVRRLQAFLEDPRTPFEDRLDAELLLREARRQVFVLSRLKAAERNPLYWTEILGNATVFLLVRDDRPEAERLQCAAARAGLIPRLARQAREALERSDPSTISSELCALAADQARASAGFYRDGFPRAGAAPSAETRRALADAGAGAAAALDALADFLEALGARATGSPRLGGDYAEMFRIATGTGDPPASVLLQAREALARKKKEAADYGRSVWPEIFPALVPPGDDAELLRSLFRRVERDRAASTDEFVDDYRRLVDGAIRFVRERGIVTLPDPLTLHTDRSPSFLAGQSVGGVYPAGPYGAEGKTLWFLPTPPDDATDAQRDAFFADFNHHFNVMITPHEIVPGHYLQLKLAARMPRKVRALFGDGVYVEGWGTFCERLMLDEGWGGPLDRLAHLKKQMENIARTIVDIEVHTAGMTREQVLAFVQDEALQKAQFASNMWTRAITTSPQLTTYWLGYRQVWGLYEDVKAARGGDFRLRDFTDGMMTLGPVPVAHYRARLLPGGPVPGVACCRE